MPFTEMPPIQEMYQALCDRNSEYEGVFFVGVRTTGIFCRPTCPARKPKLENVDFYRSVGDALSAGFRACKKCKPLEAFGKTPAWLVDLLKVVDAEPARRWRDKDLRELEIEPARVRRWFKQHHGMTFHAYLRARRLATALGQLQIGHKITSTGLKNGFESISGFRESFKNWFGEPPSKSNQAPSTIFVNRFLSPLGPMVVAADRNHLVLLEFADRRMLETQIKTLRRLFKAPFAPGENKIILETQRQLGQYFAGNRKQFSLPIDIRGTDFQVAVWKQLLDIPYGVTTSYKAIGEQVNRAKASRAIGKANGDNRIAIVIPCHRVVGSSGELTGYGGGLHRKRWLLNLETTHLSS